MTALREYIRTYSSRPMVRPLALLGPVLVLLICLPQLRPLRHPADISTDEQLRIATIRALVERGTLALGAPPLPTLEGTVLHDGQRYSAQPPMMSVLLSVPAWMLVKLGFSFDGNQLLIAYLLTLLGVTLPVAAACGLIYRMSRLFELRRHWRAGLSIVVVLGSGLISYAVVLNSHAPAAALVIASAACLIHVAGIERAGMRWIWMILSGACAGLAATLDPGAAIFLILLVFVVPAMRFPIGLRAAGVVFYILGAAGPLALHYRWSVEVTGNALPAVFLDERAHAPARGTTTPVVLDESETAVSRWSVLAAPFVWLIRALFGAHGLLSHFPIVIFGVAGVFAVMHRHWPPTTKVLAGVALSGAVTVVLLYCVDRMDFRNAMFATRWFIVFTPILLFWLGAWVRRSHAPATWALGAILLGYSMMVGLIGTSGPCPSSGFTGFTALSAAKRLFVGQTVQPQRDAGTSNGVSRSGRT